MAPEATGEWMGTHNAYESAETAELYDVVYADSPDVPFWEAMAAGEDSVLELGCGTGRLMLPLARGGRHITGIDSSRSMLERLQSRVRAEPAAVRGRVTMVRADMTTFDLGRRFSQIYCAFGTFHHLRTERDQLASLTRCREHILPTGTLLLDLINAAPALSAASGPEPGDAVRCSAFAEWSGGRRVRGWVSALRQDPLSGCSDCEVTYEVIERDGSSRRVAERFPMRFIAQEDVDGLLDAAGFRLVALFGDYDFSGMTADSPSMIVVAAPKVG